MKNLNKDKIGISVLAYNRVKHLKKTIGALKKYLNTSDKIYIFLDYKKNDTSIDDQKKFNEVVSFCNKIQSKRIIIIKSKKHLGPKKNWYRAYDDMFKKYTKVIVIEDDIIIKKKFINFMSYYLNKFENNHNIMTVTGYSAPVILPKNYQYDCYLSNRSMSWSKATWKRVWLDFKKMKKNKKNIINNKKNLLKLASAGEDLIRTINLDYLKIVNSFQVWWIWNMVQKKGYSINPIENLITNSGFDGTGFHMNKKEIFNYNKVKIKTKKKMQNFYFSKIINDSFLLNFKIKKLSFLFYLYLSSDLINY